MVHFFIYILLGSTIISIGVIHQQFLILFFFCQMKFFSLFPDQLAYLPKTSWHFIPSQHGTVPSKWGRSLDVSFWDVNINAQKRWTRSITDGQEGIRHKLVTGLITTHKYNRHSDTLPWSTRTTIPKLYFHQHLQFPHQSRFITNILRLVFFANGINPMPSTSQ